MMANQTLAQLDRTLLASVLGNCQVQISFRCSRDDAEKLARQAFRATGKQIKFQLPNKKLLSSEPRSTPVFIPVSEEMEGYINFLLDLAPRQALLNIRGEGIPVPFRTAEAPDRPTSAQVEALRIQLLARAARPRDVVRTENAARHPAETHEPETTYWIPS